MMQRTREPHRPRRLPRLLGLAFAAIALALPSSSAAVDGVVEINQARAGAGAITGGDLAGFPVTLDAGGSYRLTSDLVVPDSVGGVVIDASDVTLDLNGFSIVYTGTATFRDGILVTSETNVEIRNGSVRSFSRTGIFSTLSTDVRVIDVRSIDNGIYGMNLEGNASGEGGHVVRGCHVAGSGSVGIRVLGTGGMVTDSVIRDSTGLGLQLSGLTSSYGGNVFAANNGGGAQVSNGLAIACNNLNGAVVCP